MASQANPSGPAMFSKLRHLRLRQLNWRRFGGVALGLGLFWFFFWLLPSRMANQVAYEGGARITYMDGKGRAIADIKAERLRLANDTRRAFAHIGGGLLVIVGLILTWRTLEHRRKTQVDERFVRGVDLLGKKDSLSSRVGAAFVLEQVAIDAPQLRRRVIHTLTAHVRSSAPLLRTAAPGTLGGFVGLAPPKQLDIPDMPMKEGPEADVQAALTVIGAKGGDEYVEKNLEFTDLPGADLRFGHYEDANLHGANLSEALLQGAHLSRAWLGSVDLPRADLRGAIFRAAHLPFADLRGAWLEQTDLRGADLSKAKNLRASQLAKAITDETTKLPEEFAPKKEKD